MNIQVILHTPRLKLCLPAAEDVGELEAFERRNSAHLSPWRAVSGEPDWSLQIIKWQEEFIENRSVRFILFLREDEDRQVIGFCNFSQIFRGPFQACYLGYHIDSSYEGQGLMAEAVKKAIAYMFTEQNIHRIMANYMPSNVRSTKLLKTLGFTIEGVAKNYLLINGKWEDHVLTSLTNSEWFALP